MARQITSPTFGPLDCVWLITVPLNKIIHITFPRFNVERSSYSCSDEYLQVFEGNSSSVHSLSQKLCGKTKPYDIVSYGNQVFLKYTAGSSRRVNDFKITFKEIGKS